MVSDRDHLHAGNLLFLWGPPTGFLRILTGGQRLSSIYCLLRGSPQGVERARKLLPGGQWEFLLPLRVASRRTADDPGPTAPSPDFRVWSLALLLLLVLVRLLFPSTRIDFGAEELCGSSFFEALPGALLWGCAPGWRTGFDSASCAHEPVT